MGSGTHKDMIKPMTATPLARAYTTQGASAEYTRHSAPNTLGEMTLAIAFVDQSAPNVPPCSSAPTLFVFIALIPGKTMYDSDMNIDILIVYNHIAWLFDKYDFHDELALDVHSLLSTQC